MPKLKLDLDSLDVETFQPAREAEDVAAPEAVRTPMCSAIDLCPTRPC